MVDAKGLFDAVPAEALTDFAQFPPPAVFARAMRTAMRLTANLFMPPVNVTISNVPGPREPLYTAGARLLHYYPVSTIVDCRAAICSSSSVGSPTSSSSTRRAPGAMASRA